MSRDQIAEKLISDIKSEFPDIGDKIEHQMRLLDISPEDKMYTQMFECFSQATTDAIKTGDNETASKHLNFMSRKLDNASSVELEYIDVYYTEPLMWDIKDRKIKSRGWKLFPKNIKKLYEGMWGEQNL